MDDSLPAKFKLLISYDGTSFGGWQVQPNASSIQMHIQNALSIALRTKTHITGSGRTDSGVHALEQVAHFSYDPQNSSEKALDLYKLRASLNGLLPVDIRIKTILPTTDDFHARYSATGKIYRYALHLNPVCNPFNRLYSYHLPYPINLDLLQKASKLFIGTHDFTSFSNEPHRGSASHNPVRTLTRLEMIKEEEGIYLEFEGNGFLYKMVRNIVGTLLDVARGKLILENIPAIFNAKDRKAAGPTAPPHGLFLVRVIYEE